MTNVIEDDLGTVIAAMRSDVDGAPFYMYGHRLEISNRLISKGTNSDKAQKRYPLVALKLDTPAIIEGDVIKYNLNVAILASTDRNYNAEQRLANVMTPVLMPLYISFLSKLKSSGLFMWDSKFLSRPPHVMVKRYFYGTLSGEDSVKNIFNDPLDAIELVDLKINSTIKYC